MGAVMWIEVLSRHGEVASRSRIDAPQAHVGRAFDNDVVVDDPHVAPHHLRIVRDADGALVAEDLGSVNGLYAEHGAERVPRLALGGAPGLRIGRTVLRVHDAARPVAPEKPLMRPRAHAAWAAGLAIAVVGSLLLVEWLAITTERSWNVMLLPIVAFAAFVVVWSGMWALLSHLFFGQARFALQLRIALTGCLAFLLWDQLGEWLAYGLAWRELDDYASFGVWALLAALCYGHLLSIGPRRLPIAMGIIVALLASGAAIQFASKAETRRVVGERATLGELKPPRFRIVAPATPERFLQASDATKRAVDEARKREPPSGGPLDFDPSD
ncbi:MAG TPA: FHA domain-containing protein [Usitatibacter sp.]|nr:FHA domain-containing protein [Usitatibacter sp.]